MGEGEFALVREELEVAFGQSAMYDYVGDHDVHTTMADVASLQRDEAGIRRYAPKAEELAIHYDHKLYRAVVSRAWAVAHTLAGEYDQAEARLSQALELLSPLGARWQIGRTYYEQGELAVARSDLAAARAAFTQAVTHFEAMRAAPDLARARAALAGL